MAVFANLVNGLKRAEQELEAQLKGVRAAIASLASGGAPMSRRRRRVADGAATEVRRKRKPMSAEARAKIAAAQRARWARQKAAAKKNLRAS